MNIDIEKIKSGELDGEYIYICDLRYIDYTDKPIRNIEPQKVLIRSNEETTTSIYYSKSHFVALKKNGEPSKKVIPLFDNTGNKWYTGISVQCFDNPDECVAHYKEQLQNKVKAFQDINKTFQNEANDTLEKITNCKIKGN